MTVFLCLKVFLFNQLNQLKEELGHICVNILVIWWIEPDDIPPYSPAFYFFFVVWSVLVMLVLNPLFLRASS